MARIDGSSPKSPLIPTTRTEAPTAPSISNTSLPTVKGDDFGSKTPTRIPSGSYKSVISSDPKLAAEFASLTAASRSGLLAVKSGGGGTETKGFTAASFAKSLEGKSREQVGEAFAALDPRQQQAVQAGLLKGTINSPQLAIAALNGMQPKDQQAFLKKLPKNALQDLTKTLRTEAAPEKIASVVVAVSVELAGRTKWAQKNKGAMEALRKTHADMKLMGGETGGLGSFNNGTIKYADKLLRSPEALASTLAHEGTHAAQGAGESSTGPAGEAAGNFAGGKVWAELRPDGTDDRLKDPNNLTQLNKYARLANGPGGEKAVLKEVTTVYLNRAQQNVTARNANPGKTYAEGDTAADWQKYVDLYKKTLADLK